MIIKENYTAIGNRIEYLIKYLKEKNIGLVNGKMNNEVFARSIDIDPGQLSGVKKGVYSLTMKQVLEINSKFNVRVGWLLEGEEPVFKNERSGTLLPDQLVSVVRKHVEQMRVSLEELNKVLPQQLEPGTNVDPDAPFQPLGRKKKVDKP